MGLFAVLREPDNPFSIVHCHLNLWVLGGLFGHRRFFFDVGLRIRADKGHTVQRFEVALPFEPLDEFFRDLYEEMQQQKNLYLIFGKKVVGQHQPGTGYTIDYDGTPVRVFSFKEPQEPVPPASRQHDVTLRKLELAQPIAVNSEGYVRFRFEATRMGRAWSWKRFLLAKNGAIVDFRVADVREVMGLAGADALLDSVIEIQRLFMFVIAPASLVPIANSPSLHYMRMLEGPDWESYLGRASYFLRRSQKMVIYEWRRESVTPLEPFRGFLSLARPHGYQGIGNHVVTALVTTATIAILLGIWDMTRVAAAIASVWRWLVGLALAVGLLKGVSYVSFVKGVLRVLRGAFLKTENSIMRRLKR